ncbi:MAG: GNAT family N-acetyltransferase [Actinomycetota bacterium]|nr:GNAT family N-acetyltransferase [Actinomycetota bacterium]
MDDHEVRVARAADAGPITDLVAQRLTPADAANARLLLDRPEVGPGAFTVAVDRGGHLVGTVALLDATMRVGEVAVPAGELVLLAVDRAHEGRGIARHLCEALAASSLARGHLVRIVVGIPYFYRRLGYEYVAPHPAHRPVAEPAGGSGPSGPAAAPTSGAVAAGGAWAVRPAGVDDLDRVALLHAAAQRSVGLALVRSPEAWRRLLDWSGSCLRVATRDGAIGAAARVATHSDVVVITEAVASDATALRQLVAATAAEVGDRSLFVDDRHDTLVASVWSQLAAPAPVDDWYYLGCDRPVALLDLLRPELEARLARSPFAGVSRELTIGFYRWHVRLPIERGRIGELVAGGPLRVERDGGPPTVPPDAFLSLVLGPWTIDGLASHLPDARPGEGADLVRVLFPPARADLLTTDIAW